MKTQIITIDEHNIDENALRIAGDILRTGGLVAFPTETVYGLGGDALNPESARKIYAAKGRPSDNPLIVHICKWEDLLPIVSCLPREAERLADIYWPGPLTMILKKSDMVPPETTGGLDSVAVRMPQNPIARKLIEYAGGYIAAPSANLSGKPSPTKAEYVTEDMDGRIDMIIDGGEVGIGLESTIVDLTVSPPQILRPGYITEDMLKKVLGEVNVDHESIDADSPKAPRAPGMKYRHYAPRGDLTIIEGPKDKVVQYINSAACTACAKGEKVGVIAASDTVSLYRASSVKCVGDRTDEESIAHRLYGILREFDDEDVTVIYSESFEYTGLGSAIMNRLLKAAGHKVITL